MHGIRGKNHLQAPVKRTFGHVLRLSIRCPTQDSLVFLIVRFSSCDYESFVKNGHTGNANGVIVTIAPVSAGIDTNKKIV